jgi:hypothetical protein
MKTIQNRLIVLALLLSIIQPTFAQWSPSAVGIFNQNDWVDQIRIGDANHVWAGVTNRFVYNGTITGVLPRLVHTNNGGQTWEINTIPGTENYLGWGFRCLAPTRSFGRSITSAAVAQIAFTAPITGGRAGN